MQEKTKERPNAAPVFNNTTKVVNSTESAKNFVEFNASTSNVFQSGEVGNNSGLQIIENINAERKEAERIRTSKFAGMADSITQEADNLKYTIEPETTIEGRFASFLSKGKFNDLDPSITAPNFRYNFGGVDCIPGGEICSISGKPGVGKSTMLAVLAAVAISGYPFGSITRNFAARKVLWIDNEKGCYSCQKKMATFRNVAHIPPDQTLEDAGLDFWRMREETWADRIPFIRQLAGMAEYDIIIIDGIIDLTDKPNEDTINVMNFLQQLAEGGAAVFAMLHTNKNDDNMRYALGTENQRLSTTRIETKFENGEHWIECAKSNDTAPFPKIYFGFDENGIAMPKDGKNTTTRESEKAKEMRIEAEKYFEPEKRYRHKEACEAIIRQSDKKTTNTKEREKEFDNAKKKLASLHKSGILKKDESGMYFLPQIDFPQMVGE